MLYVYYVNMIKKHLQYFRSWQKGIISRYEQAGKTDNRTFKPLHFLNYTVNL